MSSPKDGRWNRFEYVNRLFQPDEQNELSAISRSVGAYLASRADEDGKCWPSVATIASCVGRSQNSVRKALDELEAARLLTRTRRQIAMGWCYTFSLCTPSKVEPPSTTEPLHEVNPFTQCADPLQPVKVTPSPSEGKQYREQTKEQSKHASASALVMSEEVERVIREVESVTGRILDTREAQQVVDLSADLAANIDAFLSVAKSYRNAKPYNLVKWAADRLKADAERIANNPKLAAKRARMSVGSRESYAKRPAKEFERDERTDAEILAAASPERVAELTAFWSAGAETAAALDGMQTDEWISARVVDDLRWGGA